MEPDISSWPKYLPETQAATLTFREATQSHGYITVNFNSTQVVEFVNRISNIQNFSLRKNDLQITAIRNLYKAKKLGQLDLQFASLAISEEEYTAELNSDKYTIDMNSSVGGDDVFIIKKIIDETGIDLDISVDEISEMFSLDTQSLVHSSTIIRVE